MDTLSWLNCEVDLVDWAKDLVDLSDGGLRMLVLKLVRSCRCGSNYLILEVDWCVEVWDFGVGRLANHLALGRVQERTELEDSGWRSHISGESAACA